VLDALARVALLAVAVPGLLLCADRIGDHAHAVRQQQDARACPAGTPWDTAEDCLAEVRGEIAGVDSDVSCTYSSTGGQSCTTHYYADVRFGQHTMTLGVGKGLYDDVERGDPAALRFWRGDVVRLAAGGHVEEYMTPTEWAAVGWLFLGWALLGVAWVAVLGLWLYPVLGGWLLLAVPYLLVAHHVLGLSARGPVGWTFVVVLTVGGLWAMSATRRLL
jgi:hypothetical protein